MADPNTLQPSSASSIQVRKCAPPRCHGYGVPGMYEAQKPKMSQRSIRTQNRMESGMCTSGVRAFNAASVSALQVPPLDEATDSEPSKRFRRLFRYRRTIPTNFQNPHNKPMKEPFNIESPELNEAPEPTAEQSLQLRIIYLESDLQRAHNENRLLRVRLNRLNRVLGVDDGERAA